MRTNMGSGELSMKRQLSRGKAKVVEETNMVTVSWSKKKKMKFTIEHLVSNIYGHHIRFQIKENDGKKHPYTM